MQTVPDDVKRLWDSMLFANNVLPDDYETFDRETYLNLFSDVAEIIDEAIFPDQPDLDDYRPNDTWGDDYRIEEALEGCPFDCDTLLER